MISRRAASLSPSLTLAIDSKAKQMKAEGLDVVGFGAGPPGTSRNPSDIVAAKHHRPIDERAEQTRYVMGSQCLACTGAKCGFAKLDEAVQPWWWKARIEAPRR